MFDTLELPPKVKKQLEETAELRALLERQHYNFERMFEDVMDDLQALNCEVTKAGEPEDFDINIYFGDKRKHKLHGYLQNTTKGLKMFFEYFYDLEVEENLTNLPKPNDMDFFTIEEYDDYLLLEEIVNKFINGVIKIALSKQPLIGKEEIEAEEMIEKYAETSIQKTREENNKKAQLVCDSLKTKRRRKKKNV